MQFYCNKCKCKFKISNYFKSFFPVGEVSCYPKLVMKIGKKSTVTNVTGGRIQFMMNQFKPGNATVLTRQRQTNL